MDSNFTPLRDESLRVLHWNCRSIFDKATYVENLVGDYHVICLQETWLSPDTAFLLDPNFTMARNDRNREGGGTAVAIRKDVDYDHFNKPDNRDAPTFPGLEYTLVILKNLNFVLNVVSLYRKPQVRIDSDGWAAFFSFVQGLEGRLIVCGDFNAHDLLWSRKADAEGAELLEAVLDTNFVVLNDPGSSTKVPRIDHEPCSPAITLAVPGLVVGHSWTVLRNGFFSDHLPIDIILANCQPIPKVERYGINLRKVDWGRFSEMTVSIPESNHHRQ